ncbi:hypothetical protein RFI_03746, partial [Reticulomyxa filosa]
MYLLQNQTMLSAKKFNTYIVVWSVFRQEQIFLQRGKKRKKDLAFRTHSLMLPSFSHQRQTLSDLIIQAQNVQDVVKLFYYIPFEGLKTHLSQTLSYASDDVIHKAYLEVHNIEHILREEVLAHICSYIPMLERYVLARVSSTFHRLIYRGVPAEDVTNCQVWTCFDNSIRCTSDEHIEILNKEMGQSNIKDKSKSKSKSKINKCSKKNETKNKNKPHHIYYQLMIQPMLFLYPKEYEIYLKINPNHHDTLLYFLTRLSKCMVNLKFGSQ